PCYVAIVGKLNIYEPEPGSHIISIRPDSVTVIDGKTRDDLILDAALSTTRSIMKTMENPEIMRMVAEAYEGGHDKGAYMLVAQQAMESLLTTFSAEKLDQNVPSAPVKEPETAVTKTDSDDKAGEDKKPPAGDKKKPDKKEIKESPASPPETKEKPAKSSSSYSPITKVGTIENGIKTIKEVVLEVLKEKREVKYEDIPDLLRNKGINPNMMDWESAVKRLMNEGLCCEPRLGKLKAV
ncbi:MAG: hypothetical protein Q8P40_13770, partial [Nitrospirota bacterium]|nr:hypothetical protein [Nitrospirota bacterium]